MPVRSSRRSVALLAGALLAAAAGCAGANGASAGEGAPGASASRRPRGAPMPLPELRALVRALARETAEIRGLPFAREVPVRVETPAQIAAHLREELERDRSELAVERKVGVALGVLPPAIDMVDVLSRFVGAEAQGYYDPDERVLVLTTDEAVALRSAGPEGADARATIVHELTHALQHQHFASRVEEDDSTTRPPPLSDGARARLALLEGDATLVGMEWGLRRRGGRLLGAADMRARIVRWTEGAQVLTEQDVPAYLIESAEVPYEAGAVAVASLYALGGWARVNRAIADATLRAAQVLHPERDEAASGAFVTVDPPDGADLVGRGMARALARSLGEVELRLYLGRVMRAERAAQLAEGWRGDALALFEAPDGALAVRWTIACVDDASAEQVARGLAPLAERWRREGCPGVRGGAAGRCPASIARASNRITIARGE